MSGEHRHRFRRLILVVAVGALVVAGLQLRSQPASAVTFSGPITISKGGTYSGNWESLSAGTAAVTITTSEPVVIENSNVRGRGHLILGRANLNLTVRNTNGYGLNSMVRGKPTGRFVTTEYGFSNLVVENNYLEQTAGIWVYSYAGNYTANNTVRIVGNKVKNIDGRHSDGAGGYLTGANDATFMQFVQFDKVRNIPNAEIAWNEVVNDPYKSRVEDNINFYMSGGAASSPMKVHDNLIWGAYPTDPATQGFSGGGILMGDEATGSTKAGYVEVYGNQIIGTTNYGLSIVCGNDQSIHDNRILAANVLADGRQIAAQNVGLSMGSAAMWGGNCDNYTNNSAKNNVVGWQRSGGSRNDWWVPSCNSCSGNTSMAGPITLVTEQAEYARWLTKLTTNGRVVGLSSDASAPNTSPTLPPATTTTAAPTTTTTAAPTTTTTTAPTTTTTAPPTTTPPTTTNPPTDSPKRPMGAVGSASYSVSLSSLAPSTATNGWGPYERNMSNGGDQPGDGGPITLNGTKYRLGLGVHAGSTLVYDIGGRYDLFTSTIGIDDEETSEGSVVFEVWADGTRVYSSGTMTPTTPNKTVSVAVSGVKQLKLVVTDAGDGVHHDHADWADPRLVQ